MGTSAVCAILCLRCANVNVVFCLTPAEDVMMETVVEVSTECGPIEEESFPIPSECEPATKKKRGGWYHYVQA